MLRNEDRKRTYAWLYPRNRRPVWCALCRWWNLRASLSRVDRFAAGDDRAGSDNRVSKLPPWQALPRILFEDVKVHIETPEQAFAEYHIKHRSGISGKDVKQQFFGHLEAADGKIKRLREAIDVVVAAEAIYPKGLADVIKNKFLRSKAFTRAWPRSPLLRLSPQ